MNSYSRTLLLASGIALAMLLVSSLVVALRLSQDVASARQQTRMWQTYALAMQQDQSLLIVHDDGQGCSDSPCCVATAERRVEPVQAAIPVSDRRPVRGFSF